VVRDGAEAVAAAASMGGPVVLKVCSADVAHKSDVGGVVLDVVGDEAVRDAFTSILATVAEKAPTARLDGVLVAPFRRGGVELIVGVNRDPVWGPVLVLGIGGVLVELLADVAIRSLPVTTSDVEEMLQQLRGAPLLRGVRGQEPADIRAVAEAVRAVADAALAWGDGWESIEVNPLRVQGRDVEALDALVIRSRSDSRTADVAKGSRS
jgi:acetate---CoA ligase (ADP-forming)